MKTDGSINISTKLDTSEAEKEAKGLSKTLTDSLSSLVKGSTAIAAVTKTFKALNSALKKSNELYKSQIYAEKQLEIAAKNNPYMSSSAVERLKAYASELQSTSNYGDEMLIPMMAELTAQGRTEAEVMDILSASINLAAGSNMSLDSAVKALNSTFVGNAGQLARQNEAIKNLTQEQLKNGEAVKIIGEQYKGMAQSMADAYTQMQNAQGDMMEALGRLTAPSKDQFAKMGQSLFETLTNSLDAVNNYFTEKFQTLPTIKSMVKNLKSVSNATVDELYLEAAHEAQSLTQENKDLIESYLEQKKEKKELSKYEEAILRAVSEQNAAHRENIRLVEEGKKKTAEADEGGTSESKAVKAYNEFKKTIENAEKEIAVRKQLGETISEQEELQTMLSVKTSAYIKMLEDAEGEITGTSERELAFIASVQAGYEQLDAMTDDVDNVFSEYDDLKELLNQFAQETGLSVVENLKAQRDELDRLAEGLHEGQALYEQYADARKKLDEQIANAQKESNIKQLENLKEYMTSFNEITKNISDAVRTSTQNQTQEELSANAEMYTSGLETYEEYCKKKEEINKKAAAQEYRIQMAEWTSNLLTASANIALGITKAIAQKGELGLLSAGLLAATGAAQIAAITAAKPVKKFANGGYVGGSSYSGDRVPILANSGELVLNQNEQAVLKSLIGANGGGGGMSLNIDVHNNMASEAEVKTQITPRGLSMYIDKKVDSSMSKGRYNASMQNANALMRGVKIV